MLMLDGRKDRQVDAALRNFGMPMGPFQMGDLAGLDIGYKSRKDRDPSTYDVRSARVADALVEMGRLGQKTNAGYYDYAPGDRTPKPSPVVEELVKKVAAEVGFKQREFTDQELVERCLLPLFNVGCEVLEEGVAYRSSDIDIVYLYGYGFPAYRGGPMFWAEQEIGLKNALDKCERLLRAGRCSLDQAAALLERLSRKHDAGEPRAGLRLAAGGRGSRSRCGDVNDDLSADRPRAGGQSRGLPSHDSPSTGSQP